jgi:phosphate/sulfate permease
MAALIIVSGCYVAYSWGANDVANATGLIAGAGVLTPKMSVIFGGLAIALGIMTWGYKVIETIGSEITHLLPIMAFSAQLASAINVHVYTIFGIPVSTSHSIVGAIFGVGLVRGTRVINLRIMREIIICWIATPFISGIISFVILKGIVLFVRTGG